MVHFFPGRVGIWARVAALLLVVLAGLGLRPEAAWASHIRAGDIQAKVDTTANPNPRRVFFKMILYTDNSSTVDEDAVTIFYGDGTSSCKRGVVRASKLPIPGNTDTSVNIYYFEHTYPSSNSFTVSYIGENRNAGVLNMDRSQDRSFYISTTINLNPSLGRNHSPILRAPAVDKGAVSQVFLHNPAAYDADGDSLVFLLRDCQYVPLGVNGTVGGAPCTGAGAGPGNNQPLPQTCPNYRLPSDPSVAPNPVQVPYAGVPSSAGGGAAIFVQDVRTGQITWNAPVANGLYNVAMVVQEFRRTTGGGYNQIGEVIRDMQIIVSATTNLRPTINIPADLCVIAGTRVTGNVTATDGSSAASPATPVALFAYSGILPPATFVQFQTGPPQAQGTFTWQTDCSSVADLPYLVVFKAQDSPTGPPATNPVLIDEKTWRITVVGPPPQNLRAVAVAGNNGNPNTVTLNWNSYQCTNARNIYIYRKIGPSSFVPGPCDTGIPANAGYTRIATQPATATSFVDNTALDRGQTYCYRIYADFNLPKGGASIASAEACAAFPGRPALLTNVDVEATSPTAGRITVRWTQPRTGGGPFDGTPSYVLSRGVGLTPATFTQVRTFSALTDVSYVDTNLDTENLQFTYKLEFVRTFTDGRVPARETSPTASSVRTSAVPANAQASAVRVNWTYNVPWNNTPRPVNVYRRTGGTGPYALVGTAPTAATGGTYTDADPALRKGQTYCYYVRTDGRYDAFPDSLNSLLNKSQEHCLVLNSPPCTPVLRLLATNCDSLASLQEFTSVNQRYANRLRWRLANSPQGCDSAIANYRVYYRPTPTGHFTLLGTTAFTSFLHPDLDFSGGCYAVQAVSRTGLVSDTSNVACQDNCVFFKLPNIYTPNGDGANDLFRPKNHSPVRRVHFQAFNRWGVKIFENTTTAADRILINWDGGGPVGEASAGAKVVDGIYFYLAEVEFADFANTKRTYKGWVEIVR